MHRLQGLARHLRVSVALVGFRVLNARSKTLNPARYLRVPVLLEAAELAPVAVGRGDNAVHQVVDRLEGCRWLC